MQVEKEALCFKTIAACTDGATVGKQKISLKS
jgi:hypothetical protein